jgi:hypothetical protein
MATAWTPLVALPLALLASACAEGTTGPGDGTPAVRTVLLHFGGSGQNRLWDTDGSDAGELSPETRGLIPLGAHAGHRVVALRDGNAVVLTTLDHPERLDTIIAPAPSSHSLASFSRSGDLVALVAYQPVAGVLVFDRVNRRADTLTVGGIDPVLPPVFSPDGTRLVLFSINELSLLATVTPRAGGRSQTSALAVSRFLNRPVFGWPLWLDEGVRMAFLRPGGDGPDTLIVGDVFPDDPDIVMIEAYRAALTPDGDTTIALEFDLASTYALTTDGTAVILGAVPVGGANPHGVFYVAAGAARLRTVIDSAGQFPMYPLFIRE